MENYKYTENQDKLCQDKTCQELINKSKQISNNLWKKIIENGLMFIFSVLIIIAIFGGVIIWNILFFKYFTLFLLGFVCSITLMNLIIFVKYLFEITFARKILERMNSFNDEDDKFK